MSLRCLEHWTETFLLKESLAGSALLGVEGLSLDLQLALVM